MRPDLSLPQSAPLPAVYCSPALLVGITCLAPEFLSWHPLAHWHVIKARTTQAEIQAMTLIHSNHGAEL